MKKQFLISGVFTILSLSLYAQKIISLYGQAIPNSIPYAMKETTLYWDGEFGGYQNVSQPTLEIFLPDKEKVSGAAVVICPGGGYGMLSYRLEGTKIAKTFARHGIAAFILKYRLPSDSIMAVKSIGPLQDAQQAIKLVRDNAKQWGVDINKVGIMGFSAGGHLASTAGTHFNKAFIPNPEMTNLRPDFMVLVYPVISMADSLTHAGSRQNLLGEHPTAEIIQDFSNELHVNEKTPPAWITHSGDDKVVVVDNSILFYKALLRKKVPAEMHLFPKGDHGFVLGIPTDEWMGAVFNWMAANGWIIKK
ncbi:alpha/beta hydrolase [Flavihumibacter fluvii]|uniref:alpha/beta hydrolase n=1 Tax=Flavihumibacter fluvii TaxID=2838157 RepID=UPI001BDF5732|nr:alpha/beta hydrolase [Flavihumibacter fluvii]ULQ54610.1 alpha/beta hydrolase [Flavihumibacter fluvii]